MNNRALQLTASFFDAKDFKYSIDDERDLISTGVGGLDNRESLKVYVVFDDDETSVGLRSHNFCKFQDNKKAQIYEVCSKMNDKFRWVKFYVDESDNTVTLATDAVISLETCGEVVFELVLRMASIGDDAYPEFMRALWA